MQILKGTGIDWRERRLISNLYMVQSVKVRLSRGERKEVIIFINCNWVVTRWQCLYYMYTNVKKKKIARKFKSGGLHERHILATWKLGNHLSTRL